MANLALYRKYRPQSFEEVVGQEHIITIIKNALATNMVSHAYMFSGPRGSGKTTTARLIAKALNCRNRKEGESEPCGKCSSCLEIKEGRSLDLIEIDAASHRGIDEMRELRDGIRFAPNKEKFKIFVIDECHQLTKEASNALLKTLEEPPAHAVFILATTEIQKMIPTIISRCQRHDFKKLTMDEIMKRLAFVAKKEGVKIEKQALELIALGSGGAVRDAEGLLDQVLTFGSNRVEIKAEDIRDLLGLVDIALISQFVDHLAKKDGKETLNFLESALEAGCDPIEFAKTLVSYLRLAMLLKVDSEFKNPFISSLMKEQQDKIKEQLNLLNIDDLQKALNLFMDAESKMKYSSIPQLPLELAIVDFTAQNP